MDKTEELRLIKSGEFNYELYQELLKTPQEKRTEAERKYCIYCYHYEEWQAGML